MSGMAAFGRFLPVSSMQSAGQSGCNSCSAQMQLTVQMGAIAQRVASMLEAVIPLTQKSILQCVAC